MQIKYVLINAKNISKGLKLFCLKNSIQEETTKQDEAVLVGARGQHFEALEGIANPKNITEQPVLAEKISVPVDNDEMYTDKRCAC